MTDEDVQVYLVRINILEADKLSIGNANSTVLVQVGKERRYTSVKRNSDCPYFNESFVFEFNTTLKDLLDTCITLSVIQPRKLCSSRIVIGQIKLDVSTVWSHRGHKYYHKWAELASTNMSQLGTKGYLKVDIFIITKGEYHVLPEEINNSDEKQLLYAEGYAGEITTRRKIKFHINIYSIKNLKKYNTRLKCNKVSTCAVHIWIAGHNIQTSEQQNVSGLVWNEKLVLCELFPTLTQRMRIEVKENKTVIAKHYLDITGISCSGSDYSFLPTYGPCFVNLYNDIGLYVGKLLMSIRTETTNDLPGTQNVETADFIKINKAWNFENILLFSVISHATLIDKTFANGNVSFELTFGLPEEKYMNCVTHTNPEKVFMRNYYYYFEYDDQKPCLSIIKMDPDLRYRMYNSNLLARIKKNILDCISKTERYLNNEEPYVKINTYFMDSFCSLKSVCDHYLDLKKNTRYKKSTELDQHRTRMCIEHVMCIKNFVGSVLLKKYKNKYLSRLKELSATLKKIIEDPQHDWPEIVIWMINKSEKVGFCKIPAREVCYSIIEEESGQYCGKFNHLFILPIKQHASFGFHIEEKVICQLKMYLWLGLSKYLSDCLGSIPYEYEPLNQSNGIPMTIRCSQKHDFQFRAHIFSGRFRFGFHESKQNHPCVRILIETYCMMATVASDTFDPYFDQTLVYDRVTLHSSIAFLKKYPPTITIETFSGSKIKQARFLGRSVAFPVIKQLHENVSSSPIVLQWYHIFENNEICGGIFAAFELIESDARSVRKKDTSFEVTDIPANIRPAMTKYRIEILFWGIRNYKKTPNKLKIVISCADVIVGTAVLSDLKNDCSFHNLIQSADLDLPENEDVFPFLCTKLFDCKTGVKYVGMNGRLLKRFLCWPYTESEIKKKNIPQKRRDMKYINIDEIKTILSLDSDSEKTITPRQSLSRKMITLLKKFFAFIFSCFFRNKKDDIVDELNVEIDRRVNNSQSSTNTENDLDWWTKYCNSIIKYNESEPNEARFVVYQNELELQPEFSNFNDYIRTFDIYKGQRIGNRLDERNIVCSFIGAVKIYRCPSPETSLFTKTSCDLKSGYFANFPKNNCVQFTVRVYIVKGLCFLPRGTDMLDIYFTAKLGSTIDSTEDDICKSNPAGQIFGKQFQLNGTLPQNAILEISAWNKFSKTYAAELIGKTEIDLEKRFYTKHRARCGFQSEYETDGYNAWRDSVEPSEILQRLCRQSHVEGPIFSDSSVTIGPITFQFTEEKHMDNREILSVAALKRWNEIPLVGCQLVPEHIETRSLFNSIYPGIEQGKLQMWVDIFPHETYIPLPLPVFISPRQPVEYELRVIIWNTKNVVLDDFYLDVKSDIYVQGWLSDANDCQKTDIHYYSLTGDGSFNWRFVFNFNYDTIEHKIVINSNNIEKKVPCKLTLQVWDSDVLFSNDFLGTLTLDLEHFCQGAKKHESCSLEKTDEKCNLFEMKHAKGWWPFKIYNENSCQYDLAGKVEAEFDLLTKYEARKNPLGVGRDELPEPDRPDYSLSFFKNPLKMTWFYAKRKLNFSIFSPLKILWYCSIPIIVIILVFKIPDIVSRLMVHNLKKI